jgi:hypothetical protein
VWIQLTNTNGLVNAGTTAATTVAPSYWLGPIDNYDNLDFCYINFQGKIDSITTGGIPAGSSTPRWAIVGRPFMSDTMEADPLFATHPSETQTFAIAKAGAWWSNSLGFIASANNATPPYFGMMINVALTQNMFQVGFPFSGVAITAEDRWSHGAWAGWQRDGSRISISGLREFWVLLRYSNPTLAGGNPSAMNISGSVVAHLYEHRVRR